MSTNEIEQKKYKWLNQHTSYGKGFHGQDCLNFVRGLNPTSLLDVGTGNGKFCKEIKKYVDNVYGLEWAIDIWDENKGDGINYFKCAAQEIPLPDKSVDVVTSFDFLEHIIPQDVPKVMKEMVRVCKRAMIHKIATKPSGSHKKRLEQIFGDGELHQTQQPRHWWFEQFELYGQPYSIKSGLYVVL